MIVTVSNLFPRPDAEGRGIYNVSRFSALNSIEPIVNICPVMEWRLWKHRTIKDWSCPVQSPFETNYVPIPYIPVMSRRLNHSAIRRGLVSCESVLSDADILVASWLYPDGLAAAEWAGKDKRRGIIVQGSDSWHLKNHGLAEHCRRLADEGVMYFPVAKNLEDRLLSAGVPSSSIKTAVNGVDGDKFHFIDQDEARQVLGSGRRDKWGQPDDRILLFIGNLERVKGPDTMLQVMEELKKRNCSAESTIKLIMIGQGSMVKTIARTISDKGLDNVELVGRVPHSNIPFWLNAADALCVTSRDEGMPNVVLEAAACGLPVISFRVGGVHQLAEDHAGIDLVNPNDVNMFVSSMNDALAREYDRSSMSQTFRSQRTWSKQAQIIHNALNESR